MNIGDIYQHRQNGRCVEIMGIMQGGVIDPEGSVTYTDEEELVHYSPRKVFEACYRLQRRVGTVTLDTPPALPPESQHPADLKPRGQKAPMYLIPWEVVPDHECPFILRRAGRDPAGLASLCLDAVGLEEVARVFEYGAKKYARDNWRTFPWDDRAEDEYFGAICRHLVKDLNGETIDPESGCLHVAHAAAGALIWLARRAQPCSP